MADLKLEYNRKKLTNIVNMLAEAKRGRNLRKADVVDIAEEGVKVVKDNFPRSGGKSALEREFGPGVIDAWDVVPTSRGFGFEIANKKALKDERLNTVLAALNYGSSEYTRYVQSRERFFGKTRPTTKNQERIVWSKVYVGYVSNWASDQVSRSERQRFLRQGRYPHRNCDAAEIGRHVERTRRKKDFKWLVLSCPLLLKE